jgi:hypothetical protein
VQLERLLASACKCDGIGQRLNRGDDQGMGFAPVLGTPKAQRIAQVALGDVDLL